MKYINQPTNQPTFRDQTRTDDKMINSAMEDDDDDTSVKQKKFSHFAHCDVTRKKERKAVGKKPSKVGTSEGYLFPCTLACC